MKYSTIYHDILEDKNANERAYLSHHIQSGEYYPLNHESEFVSEPVAEYVKNTTMALPIVFDIPFPPPESPQFTFIDLFAGIGGFRLALQNQGGKCVFSSEFNKYAQDVYEANYGEYPFGDITEIPCAMIPDHDVLCAGFPCQPFSISGKMKGFEDTRGTLIYNVFKIIAQKSPTVVFLENVKHLVHHDSGKTLHTILAGLYDLGYRASWRVLNASDFGVAQNRERIIIIAHKSKIFNFDLLKKTKHKTIAEIADPPNSNFEYLDDEYTLLKDIRPQSSGLIFVGYRNKNIRKAGVRPGTEHLSRVHKQPNRIYSINGVHPALPSQETSGRFWIFDGNKVRKLTINECYKLMGFPEKFIRSNSLAEQYRQVGNSVCVPMIEEIASQIKTQLLS